jgi:hypothetical protein
MSFLTWLLISLGIYILIVGALIARIYRRFGGQEFDVGSPDPRSAATRPVSDEGKAALVSTRP